MGIKKCKLIKIAMSIKQVDEKEDHKRKGKACWYFHELAVDAANIIVKRIPFNILMSWDQVQAFRDCRHVSCSIGQSVRVQWPQIQQDCIREDSHSIIIFLGRVRIKVPNEKEAGYGSIQQNIQQPFQMMLLKLQPGTGRLMLGCWQQQALGLCVR